MKSAYFSLFFILFLSLISESITAQVIAPDLICVKEDTLRFDIPVNTCGNFNSFDIYFSSERTGPYEVIASIIDPATRFFVHNTNLGGTKYYYMQSNYDCPDETVLSSDTLDNQLPTIAPIRMVSVEEEQVIIRWEASTSPEVNEYIIYRITTSGTIPIDTVMNTFRYVDEEAIPTEQPEAYYVLAADACGNTSIFDTPHQTMLLGGTESPCEQTILLSWNSYEAWENNIAHQEIWVSIDGGEFEKVDSIAGNRLNYIYRNINDETNYCFYIQTIEQGRPDNIARSTTFCIDTDVVQPNRTLHLYSISQQQSNVLLNWTWDTNAEVNEYSIYRSLDGQNFEAIYTESLSPPLSPSPSYQDVNADLNNYIYLIETRDDCDSLKRSNLLGILNLSGRPTPQQNNLLTWNEPFVDKGVINNYTLYKVIDGIEAPIYSDTTAFYEDVIAVENEVNPTACYVVEADVSLFIDNEIVAATLRSQEYCLEQMATIYMPNAFTPSGNNPIFKPVIAFGTPVAYEFYIFDRWGKRIFATQDLEIGWNGMSNGRVLNQGVYNYYVRIEQANQQTTEKAGTVLLLK